MLHCPLQQHYAHSSQEEKTLAEIKRERIAIETSLPVGGEKKWNKAIETSLLVGAESGSSRVSNYESRAGELEIAEGEDASPLFRPPKRTRSAVWEFFGYLKDEDGKVLRLPSRWNADLQTLQEKSALQSGKHVQHGTSSPWETSTRPCQNRQIHVKVAEHPWQMI